MGWTDFDVTTGQLQNQHYFQEVYCMVLQRAYHNCRKTMVCGAAIDFL